MSSGVRHESVSHSGVDQDVSTSQPNMQMSVACKVVAGSGHLSTVYPDSTAVAGVPVDAPLTVKQHFQQQRKQQKNRARENKRETKKQTPSNPIATPASLQKYVACKSENITKVTTDHHILHPARALSEPAFFHHSQSHQCRPSTSKSADQEIFRSANMKVDPRILGFFNTEDYGIICGTMTSKENPCTPTHIDAEDLEIESSLRNTFLEPSVQPYDPSLRLSGPNASEQKSDDVHVRNERMRQEFIQYSSSKYDSLLSNIPTVHSTDNSRLASCGSIDFPCIYSSMDGLDIPNVHSDSGMAVINGAVEQNHADTDPTSLDQSVEKLDTETDERFLSWLYCENEHAEDDNAEYTRVLEEIEKDECCAHKIEENEGQDSGVPTCLPSTSHLGSFGRAEFDFSNPLTSDCAVEDYASVPPTMQSHETLQDNCTGSDFDSDLDFDVMPIREDEETLYGRLLDVLVRDIKLLTYNNAALVDEVSRLNYAIFVASEERKVLARRSCHHDRNRIRRLQTANKRKSDAQRRQQEQLTIAETQENIAQIKAKMAKTIVSSQKVVKHNMCSASSRPILDVAAIKRTVEAEQRALEDKISSRKATRKVGNSRFQRKRHEYSRLGRKRGHPQGSTAKRGRTEAQRRVHDGCSIENSPMTFDPMHFARKTTRGSGSGGEGTDDQDRKRRRCSQMSSTVEDIHAGRGEESDEAVKYANVFAVVDQKLAGDCTDAEQHFVAVINDENESGKSDQSQRRRAGRPPARAASAAAQTLLAAELAASADAPVYSPKRTNRSRSSTNEPISYRPPRRRVVPHSHHDQDWQLDESSQVAELRIDVSNEATVEEDMDLGTKYEFADEDFMPLGDATGTEGGSTKVPQRLRSVRRSRRTSSRQSIGETGDGVELVHQEISSPSHEDVTERSEEPVSMATRSHGRTGTFSSSQAERQIRERKHPAAYSPVAGPTSAAQPRVVKKKS